MKQVTIKPPKQAPRDISTKLPPGVPPSALIGPTPPNINANPQIQKPNKPKM